MASQIQQEALVRATQGITMGNFPAIFAGFEAKGIPEADILPRENVFTYHAWRALGRQVRKGEHGVRVCTYVNYERIETDDDGKEKRKRRSGRKMAYVFHVSQTDPIGETMEVNKQ